MVYSLHEDARAVLLPAFDGTRLSEGVARFLDNGGVSILLGESRSEYVARGMSAERRASETVETFHAVTGAARARSNVLLACVDQELGGICRLHDLVPSFPQAQDIAQQSEHQIEALAHRIALQAVGLGVNVFLAPIVDVLLGRNEWLQGRTWSSDPAVVGALSAAFVRGIQSAGVAATVKHFPGFGAMTADPAIVEDAINPLSLAEIEAGFPAFQLPISAGAEMVMVGPAAVRAIDAEKPSLRSASTISLLRNRFGFSGVVMADDLDAKAAMRGATIHQVAIDALTAGCDLLLLADIGQHLDEVANAIVSAVQQGLVSATGLALSAQKVRDLAHRYTTQGHPVG